MKLSEHILPFLWLHGEDEPVLRNMIRRIAECGIGSVCLESRPHPDFGGPKWWHDLDILLDEAQKNAMKVWILDDSHFPTGYANGRMKDAPDELCKQYLASASADVCGPMNGGCLDVRDLMKPKPIPPMKARTAVPAERRSFHDDRLLFVTARPVTAFERLGEPLDLTASVRDGILTWDVPAGQWRVTAVFLTRNGGGNEQYINLLNADSVDVLIDEVYEPHYAHYKQYFGSTIAGFFSDEPNVGNTFGYDFNEDIGRRQMQLPWAPEMETLFRGADLKDADLLWNDSDSGRAAEVRLAYMNACTSLVSKNFSDRLGSWCERHGVEYIGHIIEDSDQHMRLGCSVGHFFRGMSGMHMAGIDDIGNQIIPYLDNTIRRGFTECDGEFFHFALGKLGASLAQCDPKKRGRTMCELFGAYGWTEGVKDMKWITDHLLVRGVNYFVPHAFTCSDFPEPDCPPHFYAQGHNPQFRHFGALARYMGTMGELFDGGKPVIDATILYPAESHWMGESMKPAAPARVLAESQRDFLFLPIDRLDEIPRFPLIVPACEHIPQAAAAKLSKLGDRVIWLDRLPEEVREGNVIPLDRLRDAVAGHLFLSEHPKGLRFYHYRKNSNLWMFFNEGTVPVDVQARMNEGYFLNTFTGERIRALRDDGLVRIALEAGESIVYVEGGTVPAVKAAETVRPAVRFAGWSTAETYPAFTDAIPCDENEFSGIMAYECGIDVPGDRNAVLKVDSCNEVMEVFVNGASQGFAIAGPYRVPIRLSGGMNRIRIEVTNSLGRKMHAYDASVISAPRFRPPLGLGGEVTIDLMSAEQDS